MYPNADIPCLQVSLVKNLDPQAHINLGKALASLRDEPVLIVGSGFTFHNMRAFLTSVTPSSQAQNVAFERWLRDTCTNTAITEVEREALFSALGESASSEVLSSQRRTLIALTCLLWLSWY